MVSQAHIPKQEMKNGVLYFNPGSAGPRRFHLPVTVGRLIVKGAELTARFWEFLRRPQSVSSRWRASPETPIHAKRLAPVTVCEAY